MGLAALLVACTQTAPQTSDQEQVVPTRQSSSVQSSIESSSSVASLSGATREIAWKQYEETELGIAFRYPSHVGDGANFDCNTHLVPLKVFSKNERLILAQEYYLTPDCASMVRPTNEEVLSESLASFPFDASGKSDENFYPQSIAGSLLNIWVMKAKNDEELLGFVHRIYGPACRFDEERQQRISDAETHIFLATDSTSVEDSFACGDKKVLWNPQRGVAMTFFMPLKTAVTFSTMDHRDSYDLQIAESFHFLP